MLGLHTRARSLAWLERPADNREVSSSNLVGPTITSLPRFVPKTILSLAFLLSVSNRASTKSRTWRTHYPSTQFIKYKEPTRPIGQAVSRLVKGKFYDYSSLWQVHSSPQSHSPSSQPQSQSSSQQHPPKTASSYSWMKSCAPIHSTTAT